MSNLGERAHVGTMVERWRLHPDDPAESCAWPTAALAGRLAGEALSLEGVPDALRFALAGLADAYVHLLTHPIGTEATVKRLRELRKLEREG
jgi:hypothetical protein